jgi:N-methylhydantoinase A
VASSNFDGVSPTVTVRTGVIDLPSRAELPLASIREAGATGTENRNRKNRTARQDQLKTQMRHKLGVDVGGTFTDIFLLNETDWSLATHKVPSTPQDPSLAIIRGISEILQSEGVRPDQISYLAHGTTVATNAIIEQEGGKVGLITTRGFRDLLEIGRQTRPRLYDLQLDHPPPLVGRDLRLEVNERILHTGAVSACLDEDAVKRRIQHLKRNGVNAVAICLLYSYVNADHETRIRDMVKIEMPDCYVSVSHEVLPEFREYERLSTTTLNAFLMPVMDTYLRNFRQEVEEMGVKEAPRVSQCNGGIMSVATACRFPLRTALSGPSAGVIGALFIANAIEVSNLITFDMGGTSTDVCLLDQGTVSISNDRSVGGYPAKIPSVDVNAVGAGGGSIAWIDLDGFMKVGPKSAGASPGPVCYGQGSSEPTVTDANVLLGRLNPEYLLGGRMKIEKDAAFAALGKLGELIGLGPIDTALGVIDIITANMFKAIRAVSIEKGYDPKEFSLMAFGGAGPLHACRLARELEISRVIIPPTPGILCAMGLLVADARNDYVRTAPMNMEAADLHRINAIFDEMEAEAGVWLSSEGFESSSQRLFRSVDMRYVGQNFELSVRTPASALTHSDLESLVFSFYREHERNYGHFTQGEPIQLINFRVTAEGVTEKPEMKAGEEGSCDGSEGIVPYRDVCFGAHTSLRTPVYDRNQVQHGQPITGPAVIEQMDATTLVFPGDVAEMDRYGNIVICL